MKHKLYFLLALMTLIALLASACAQARPALPETGATQAPAETTAPDMGPGHQMTQAPETQAPPAETEAAPPPTEETAERTSGGTLVVAIASDPGYFNPGISTGFDVHVIADSIYNGLVGLDANANPVPDLAESWEISPDAMTYTFRLAENVTWHDGEPFTSADVKFTFEKILLSYHSRTKAGLENVLAGIDVPDEHTVVFRFNNPYAPLLQRLDVTEAPILPAHIYAGVEDPTTAEANLNPIGTGPFMFSEYTPGVEVRLVRNPNYFKAGLPKLDGVTFRIIPEEATQVAALEAGEVDYIWGVPGPDVERIAGSDQTDTLSAFSGPGGGFCIMTMTFNLERPIFQDLQVRQAFAHAIDRQQIVDQVLFGQGRVATAPIHSQITWAHLEDAPQYEYDPAKAEQLLDAAGYPRGENGVRFAVDFVHFPSFSKYGEVLREQLAQVGIDFQLRPLERDATVETVFNQRDFDTNVISYCNNTDPEIGVRRMYVSSNIGPIPFSNGSAYQNSEIDELFNQAGSTPDLEQRGELYRQIERILLADLPYWWLVETDSVRGVRSNCHDFKPWTGHFAETAWCEG
jgi:peptide/nickel transport system substrate-binding protein